MFTQKYSKIHLYEISNVYHHFNTVENVFLVYSTIAKNYQVSMMFHAVRSPTDNDAESRNPIVEISLFLFW